MAAYLREYAPTSPSCAFILYMAAPILQWWQGRTLSEIKGATCRAYSEWRTSQKNKRSKEDKAISSATAKKELSALRAAINWYHGEHGPLPSVPVVKMPEGSPRREDYWLTRQQVAARILAARAHPQRRHLVRMLLIGVYSGTRPGAILNLKWMPSTDGGWIDLDKGLIYRRPFGARQSRKRATPVRIHYKLLPHLQRWREHDLTRGIVNVITYRGKPMKKARNSWSTAVGMANADHDAPHIMRHTAATWLMQDGKVTLAEASSYLGMSVDTLLRHYAHFHPAYQENAARAMPPRTANVTPMKRTNPNRTK
jgi:integrase